MTVQAGFNVFISSTTADLGDVREELRKYFERSVGTKVIAQRPFPDVLNDGLAIKQTIDMADLVVCIVGHHHGAELSGTAPGDNIPPGVSWTQWEVLYAVERYRRLRAESISTRPELLVYFAGEGLRRRTESEDLQQKQTAFRTRLAKQLIDEFGSVFFRTFDSPSSLFEQVRDVMTKPDGMIAAIQDGRWEAFDNAYRQFWSRQWETRFPPGGALSDFGDSPDDWFKPDSRLLTLEKAPLIDSIRMAAIIPAGELQLSKLKDWATAPTLDFGFDDLRDAVLRRGSSVDLTAPRRCAGGAGDGLRLVLTTSAGVGKTTTLRRLQHEINRSGEKLALFLDADDFRNLGDDTVANMQQVIRRSVRRVGVEWSDFGLPSDREARAAADRDGVPLRSPVSMISHGIEKLARAGQLVLLVDGLDHANAVPVAIARLQSEMDWRNTDVILSGRPPAFEKWNEREERQGVPDARYWRFVVPQPISKAELKAYLGVMPNRQSVVWRHSLVYRYFKGILHVPRLLEHIRLLDPEELGNARTAADIYYGAMRHLIREGLEATDENASASDVDHCLRILSALAFQTVFDEVDEKLVTDPTRPVDFSVASKDDILAQRLLPLYGEQEQPLAAIRVDLLRVFRLSTLLGNGLLEDIYSTDHGTVRWVSRTVQYFLAAHWLSVYADADLEPHMESLDTDLFREAQFHPFDGNNNLTEELNRFLAEMPADRIDPRSWLAATRAWYDPYVKRSSTLTETRTSRRKIWPTEMIARSWRTMHALAGRQVDDWWDISYDQLSQSSPGARGGDLNVSSVTGMTKPIRRVAREVLDGFLHDFQSLVESRPDDPVIRRFITEGWQDISGGNLQMGSPQDQQGFPEKTKGYWKRQLQLAVTSDNLHELAKRTSPDSWWAGPYGKRQREEEIDWLVSDVFQPYVEAAKRGKAERVAAEDEVLHRLQDNFRRADETPIDELPPRSMSLQRVGPFTLNALPVTNEVYALFAPGHVETMKDEVADAQATAQQDYAARGERIDTGKDDYAAVDWNKPDRPAIFVTWFDAWALAQWFRWREGNVEYRCRLPHEPEWEFACKKRPPGYPPVETEFGQRYWWGPNFYARPTAPEEESISKPEAHAVGWPGAVRPPAHAVANGFGLGDMIGNVWEWCANIYDERSETEVKEDHGNTGYSRFRPKEVMPRHGSPRATRGGLWYYLNHISTASSRFRLEPADGDYKTGLRLVLETVPIE